MAEGNKNQTSNNNEQSPKTSVAFNLFVYGKELSRPKLRLLRLSNAKLDLTEGLVPNSTPKAKYYNNDDLSCLTHGDIYKQKLKRNHDAYRALKKMQIEQGFAEYSKKNYKVEIIPEYVKS